MSHLCQFWFSKCDIKLDNRMIFAMSFPGARWYVVTVWVPQMVRDEKKSLAKYCCLKLVTIRNARCFWDATDFLRDLDLLQNQRRSRVLKLRHNLQAKLPNLLWKENAQAGAVIHAPFAPKCRTCCKNTPGPWYGGSE